MMFMHRRIRRIISVMLLIGLGYLLLTTFHLDKSIGKMVGAKQIYERNRLVDMHYADIRNVDVNNLVIRILFINKPRHIYLEKGNNYIKDSCRFNNCVFTDSVKNMSQISAIVFNAQDDLQFKGTDLKKQRHSSQIWILYRAEPIGSVRTIWFRDNVWNNTMNWTWGYRLDSDIFLPHQILLTRKTQLKRDYRSIYKRKTKMAAWIVSHCHAKSLRDEYVRSLIKEGIQVDIYGKCSNNKSRVDGNFLNEQINVYYKFYLSFENNFCKDYVSEKFFNYLSLDTILIVRGGLNYSEHFDTNAFIDASSFSTVKSLARYMLMVSNDIKLYTRYLQAKDKYLVKGSPGYSRIESMCRLCKHMNHIEMYTKTYENIASYLENGTCFNPRSIV